MKHVCVEDLFGRAAGQHADSPAVEWAGQTLTYAELENESNRLGNYLVENGIRRGSVVAILSENVPHIVTAMIGVLRASCAFLPLDSRLPEKRLVEKLTIASPEWVLTGASHLGALEELVRRVASKVKVVTLDGGCEEAGREADCELIGDYHACRNLTPCRADASPDDMCSIFFTSGSTGRPKAIAGRRKGLDHFVAWEIEALGVGAGSRVSQLALPSFDGFLKDTFVPLCAGGTVCVPDSREMVLDARRLIDWVDKERINILHCVPTIFRSMLNAGLVEEYFPALKYVVMAGEPIPTADVKRWYEVFGDRIQLVNLYGPTETTVTKFFYFIQPADVGRRFIPIGKPMPGAAAAVVTDGQLSPPGVIGEIYIRTPYRALGYYNQPGLTREVFVRNPFSDDPRDIVYKTGDFGRVLSDGNFEFVGRRDQQVKIRGVRIELGEVEGTLRQHDAVKDAVVMPADDPGENKYLFAYVVLARLVEFGELREFLASHLPAYTVPSAFMALESLPLTPNGKVDRQRLPAPQPGQRVTQKEVVLPRSPTEEKIASVWAEVLKRGPVDIHDNFFELGGHSLLGLYPANSFRSAAAAYGGLCSARLVSEAAGEYTVELTSLNEEVDETRLVHEFLNYMLDLSAEHYLKGR
jgi:amino acid adenylation domain-containing protein